MSQQEFDQQKGANDQGQTKRQYGCPCGKTYLSYPALFTHVKQKHDGKAPGTLIKPKTQKARGRPKLHVDAPEDDMSDGAFNFEDQLEEALANVTVNYSETVKLSEGNRTCQDMASSFVNKTSFLKSQQKKKKNGDKFWIEQKPSDIIQVVNQINRGHEQVKKKFPIPNQTLVELIYVFFRWMYKCKWTDHKLIKRAPVKLIRPL